MYNYDNYEADERAEDVAFRRLWAGGAATAVVAALTAVAGLLIARGLFHVAVLAPEGAGIWGDASTGTYAMLAAAAALLATGLMHVLIVTTPAPHQFFGWMMGLFIVIAVVLPLTLGVDVRSRVATAVINLAIGMVITLLVSGTTGSARRNRPGDPRAAGTADTLRMGGPPDYRPR
jgi:hypothetical protein